jgi:hypothetical protein
MFDPKILELNKDVRMGIYAKPAIYINQECRREMRQTLNNLDSRQKELINGLTVSGGAAMFKHIWFIILLFGGFAMVICCLAATGGKSAPLVLGGFAVVLVVILVQIRITNATYKNELSEAMIQIPSMTKEYNSCVEDYDKINLAGSILTTLTEAESFRKKASVLNVIVLVLFSLPIVLIVIFVATSDGIGNSLDNSIENLKEWV